MHQRPKNRMQPPIQSVCRGPPSLVADITTEGVFSRYPPTSHSGIVVDGIKYLADLPSVVDRNQGVTRLVVGHIQRQRQSYPEPFVG